MYTFECKYLRVWRGSFLYKTRSQQQRSAIKPLKNQRDISYSEPRARQSHCTENRPSLFWGTCRYLNLFKKLTFKKKRKKKDLNLSNTNGGLIWFLSDQTAKSCENQKMDMRANNYLSQVAAPIVGGWRMNEEYFMWVFACVCVWVPQCAVSFWPCSYCRQHTERWFCVPRQEACFHLSGLGQLHSSIPPSSGDKGEPSGMSDWDRAGSLCLSGGGARSESDGTRRELFSTYVRKVFRF